SRTDLELEKQECARVERVRFSPVRRVATFAREALAGLFRQPAQATVDGKRRTERGQHQVSMNSSMECSVLHQRRLGIKLMLGLNKDWSACGFLALDVQAVELCHLMTPTRISKHRQPASSRQPVPEVSHNCSGMVSRR